MSLVYNLTNQKRDLEIFDIYIYIQNEILIPIF